MTYRDFKKKLDLLKADNRHGASILENALFKLLLNAAVILKKSDFNKLINHANNWQSPMASIINIAGSIKMQADNSKADLVPFIKSLQKDIQTSRDNLCFRAASIIKRYKSIVTISYSGLVCRSIILASEKGWRGTVLVAESRPVFEGRMLAKDLGKKSVNIIYGTDCQIFSLLDNAGAVFIGADTIDRRFFINKIGTRSLISTLKPKRKVYILADMSKYCKLSDDFIIPEMPSTEVWKNPPKNIKIVNRYFEKVYFDENMILINEAGLFKPSDIKKCLEKR